MRIHRRLDFFLVILIAALASVLLALYAARTIAIRQGWTPVAQAEVVAADSIPRGGSR